MIKPDAVERGLVGDILKDITNAGFKIKALKLTQLSLSEAKTFYAIHSERPFFNDLVDFIVVSEYAISKGENSVHGSDSDENAKIEAEFHFSGREILF